MKVNGVFKVYGRSVAKSSRQELATNPEPASKDCVETSLARRQLQWLVMRREDGSFFLAASVVHISLTQAES